MLGKVVKQPQIRTRKSLETGRTRISFFPSETLWNTEIVNTQDSAVYFALVNYRSKM